MCKRIMQVIFSICLVTSFYSANSMVLSPASVGMLVKPFAKVVSYGSKIAFLGAKIGAGMAVSGSQLLLKKCRIVLCKAKYGIDSLKYAQMLVDYGYDDDEINTADENDRNSILHWACVDPVVLYWDSRDIIAKVQLMISRCTDATINKVDDRGMTPLYWACATGNLYMVRLLLPRCTDATVNKVNNFGNTPLFSVCFNGSLAIVQLLLENGANVDQEALRAARDKQNNLPNGPEILRLVNLAQNLDNSNNMLRLIDNQTNADKRFLRERLLKKHGKGYPSVKLLENKKVKRSLKNEDFQGQLVGEQRKFRL